MSPHEPHDYSRLSPAQRLRLAIALRDGAMQAIGSPCQGLTDTAADQVRGRASEVIDGRVPTIAWDAALAALDRR